MAAPDRRERTLEFDFERRLDAEGYGAKVALRARRVIMLASAAALSVFVGGGLGLWHLASTYNPLSDSGAASLAGTQIATVQQAIASVYSGSSGLDGLSGELLLRSRQIPSTLISAGRMRHAFGGEIRVGLDEAASGYWLAFEDVPSRQCPLVASLGVGDSALAVTVQRRQGGQRVSTGAAFSLADAARACGRDGLTRVVWRFR